MGILYYYETIDFISETLNSIKSLKQKTTTLSTINASKIILN